MWNRLLFIRRTPDGSWSRLHQVVRDMAGTILADERVGHRFAIEHGLIQGLEVCSPPSADRVNEAKAKT
jgi:hypothetical protein